MKILKRLISQSYSSNSAIVNQTNVLIYLGLLHITNQIVLLSMFDIINFD